MTRASAGDRSAAWPPGASTSSPAVMSAMIGMRVILSLRGGLKTAADALLNPTRCQRIVRDIQVQYSYLPPATPLDPTVSTRHASVPTRHALFDIVGRS